MKLSLLLHHFPLLTLATCGHAVRLPFFARRATVPAPGTGISANLTSFANFAYTTTVTLNGTNVTVLIDTGSSDLWVASSIPGAVDQNFVAGENYVNGQVKGPVMSATLNFSGLIIDDQYFIMAPNQSIGNGIDGVLGLGTASGSHILEQNPSVASVALPPLYRMFASDSSIQSFFTIFFERSSESEDDTLGQLSIGEAPVGYKDVLDQPRLPVTMNSSTHSPVRHWQTLIDSDGIIVNGKTIQLGTNVTSTNVTNATVVLDTGFTFCEVPPSVAAAVYGDIPHATLLDVPGWGSYWVLDCDQMVNVTFKFGGVLFPIHPLDLNIYAPNIGMQLNGTQECIGGLRPYANDTDVDQTGYDMVFGMTFLWNAVMAVNLGHGSTVDGNTPANSTAYIQLLPITNATKAAQEFKNQTDNSDTGSDGDDGSGNLRRSRSQ